MPLTIDTFRNIANSAFISSRDIAVQGQGENATAKLGNYVFSQSKKTNDATLAAFKAALEAKYGIFGTHAFDTVLGARAQMHKSLRASDVTATLSRLETVKKSRFLGELQRQLDTNPKFRALSPGMRALVRKTVSDSPVDGSLADCATDSDLAKRAVKRIERGIDVAKDFVERKKQTNPKYDIDVEMHALEDRKETDVAAKPTEATGLRRLKLAFGKGEASVEDRIKSGALGAGMRVNRSYTNPVILDKLKTNGVEPGFIYRNDWSTDDTSGFMADVDAAEGTREQILLAGRSHPAGVAAAAELLIQEAAKMVIASRTDGKSLATLTAQNPSLKPLAEALSGRFANMDDIKALADTNPSNRRKGVLLEAKRDLFTEIRDAVMNQTPKCADGQTDNPLYARSPVFKHFQDRAIVKLDYNESVKFSSGDSAHAGTFMRPERILNSRKPVLGQIYRFTSRQSADTISAGAVTEALANDLTRIAGVPAQELEIVRGQYSDGHPKIMLAAKFADGYQDMEAGMLKDGRIVKPKGAPADMQMESLGKYKAFFLVTADRDGVGKRGQNKGFVNGKFFAIDPGHSLEGNGKYLEISDDLSFKDTYGASSKPRFNNFSVFDDDTRAAKFKGVLEMRELQRSGAFKQVFDDYRKAFDPTEGGISDAEKALRNKIISEINAKEQEFNESLNKLMRVAGMQLELNDDLKEFAPQVNRDDAIETLANLEKLTSPTTWVSKKGQVALNHLEVLPDSRVPWRAHLEGDNIVYYCDKPLSKEVQDSLRAMLSQSTGTFLHVDGQGTTKILVPIVGCEKAFKALSEENVIKLTHAEEHMAMMQGEDRLKVAKTYVPPAPEVRTDGKPLDSADLPATLEVSVLGSKITLRKGHFEAMVMNTPEAERPRSISELKRFLAARINRGNNILKALYAGKMSRFEPSRENITALTVAIHVAALKKGEYIYRGAFSISDPNGNIARWLDTAPGLYQRTSTHAKPYQSLQVDGHLNMPRGYDVAPGMKGLLNGMRTFHYFSIPDNDHMNDVDRGSGPNRRLYLKCETYGVFINTIHAKFSKKADSRTEEMKTRGYEFGDICESIAHGASLFGSKFTSKNAEGIRKENLPEKVSDKIAALDKKLKAAGFRDLAKAAMKDVEDGGGVRRLIENLNNALVTMPSENLINALVLVNDTLREIRDEFENLNGEIENRMGNEILVEPNDIYY